jgi:membrane-associated protease RseP (regulator of RpoE activity)
LLLSAEMIGMLRFTITLYVAWFAYSAIYTVLTAGLGAKFGLPLREVRIGFGPVLLRRQWRTGDLSLRFFPFAGSVSFLDPTAAPGEEALGNPLRNLSTVRRISTDLVGPASNGILGVASIGFVHGPTAAAIGFLGLWLCVVNLLPLPALNGFDMVVACMPALRRRDINEVVPSWILTISLLFILCANIALIYILLYRQDILLAVANLFR